MNNFLLEDLAHGVELIDLCTLHFDDGLLFVGLRQRRDEVVELPFGLLYDVEKLLEGTPPEENSESGLAHENYVFSSNSSCPGISFPPLNEETKYNGQISLPFTNGLESC